MLKTRPHTFETDMQTNILAANIN